MAFVGKGVFGVELEVVEFEEGHLVDCVEEMAHGGDAVAGDVEHDAAGGDAGRVDDAELGDAGAVLAEELAEGCEAVACAGE